MRRSTKRKLNILTYTLLVMLVLLAALLVGVRAFELQPVTIPAGAKENFYHPGTLVYVEETTYTLLKEGDTIAFLTEDGTASVQTILKVYSDPEEPWIMRFRTGTRQMDPELGTPVYYENIIGVPVFGIPLLGYAADFLGSMPGKLLFILGCALLMTMIFLPDLLPDKKRRRKKAPAAVSAAPMTAASSTARKPVHSRKPAPRRRRPKGFRNRGKYQS